jgi:hypothetical protein
MNIGNFSLWFAQSVSFDDTSAVTSAGVRIYSIFLKLCTGHFWQNER